MNQLWHLVRNYMAMTGTSIDDLPSIAAGTYNNKENDTAASAAGQEQSS
jgi:hypothetical protein